MTGTFGSAAQRLASFSAQALGWRPADFWQATPADLALAAASPQNTGESLSRDHLNQLLEREGNG